MTEIANYITDQIAKLIVLGHDKLGTRVQTLVQPKVFFNKYYLTEY
jgi:hypothetical protein